MKKKVFSLMMALLLVFPGAMFAQNRVSNGAHGTPASPLSGTPAIRAVAPNAGNATIILTAGDVWEDGSGYQMLLDADATAYGSTIPETGALSLDCSGNESIYAEFEYKLPTNADGVCETSNIVINNSVSIQIPAGTYDWCITNPTPGDRIWIAAANGSAGGRQDDYVFEAGATYEFVVSLFGNNDGVDVTVTQGETPDVPVVAGELTVHDGTATNGYVPVYGFYADAYLKSEMVYPAAELSDMANGTINSMKFYLSSPATDSWGSAYFQVFLSEVSSTSINSFYGPGTIVYEGPLDGTQSEMTINFDTPYQYNGGNLLVGVYNIAEGTYKSCSFVGEAVNGASFQGYSYTSLDAVSGSQRDFLPKTTFGYTTSGEEVVVEIGDGTSTYYYYPVNMYFHYSLTEQIYTADEIGTAGTINSVSFYYDYTSSFNMSNVTLYMKNVARTAFTSNTDMEPLALGDIVWTGSLEATEAGWITINLDTPFEYDGMSNLLIGAFDGTSGYPGSSFKFRTTPCDGYKGITWYSDSYTPDPYNTAAGYSGSKMYTQYRNNIQLAITPAEGPTYEVIDLVEINGFTAPVWGETPDNEVNVPEDANYYINESFWTYWYPNRGQTRADGVRVIDPEPIFNENDGRAYYMEIVVLPNEGYVFNNSTDILINGDASLVDMDATLVDASEVVICTIDFYPYEEGLHTLSTYGVGEDAYESIDRLIIERPNGAWMEPYHFNLYNDGDEDVEVVLIDFLHNNGYFSMDEETTEYPFTVAANGRPGVDLYINTNPEWTDTDVIESQLAVNTTERSTHLYQIVAAPYTPYCPDVVEAAYPLGNVTEGIQWRHYTSWMWNQINPQPEYEIHDNYTLPFPEIPEGRDAVIKFTVDRAMSLNARVPAEYPDGKVALYTEDFYGQPGPMADNNYTERPMQGGGSTPAGGAFEAVIGDGTSTTGYMPFYCFYNYSMSQQLFLAAELQAAGVTSAPMTSLSWYCTGTNGNLQSNITIWMANVAETAIGGNSIVTSGMTKVYTGNMTPTVGWDEFVFNQGNFSWDGHSNILISVQRNNGAWASGINWQCGTQSFTASGYSYNDSQGAYNMETNSYVFGTSGYSYGGTTTNRSIVKMKGGNRNRDAYTYGFENGLDGWTALDVNVDGGTWVHSNNNPGQYDYTEHAHGGSGFAMCYSFIDYDGAYDTDSYLISPQQYTLDNNSSITFWADNANDDYPESFSVCVSTAANPTASSFTQVWGGGAKAGSNGNATVRATNNRYDNWRSHTVNLGAYAGQTVWIAFHDVNYDAYEIWIDDVTINAASSAPVDPDQPVDPEVPGAFAAFSAGPVIENLNILPGTYYLVASSTATEDYGPRAFADPVADFEVEIGIEDLPCPEKAVVVAPVDNAEGIQPNSVTLKWLLDPNCTEYRLTFSTTYWPDDEVETHPQTILVDWTNDLAEEYTVTNLWNNTNYFWRVDQRTNGGEPVGCTTIGDIWGFTTHFNVPGNLTATPVELFEGQTTTLNWNSIVDRTYRYYFIYKDDEYLDRTTVNQVNMTTYTVAASELPYNMEGYKFNVTAIYDEGESAFSNDAIVKVSGYTNETGINGYAYEQDGVTPIGGVTVTITGTDEFGHSHTYTATTNDNGYYNVQVYVGEYTVAVANKDGYQETTTTHALPFNAPHQGQVNDVNFIMDEVFYAPANVCAETVEVGGEELVKIWWDFNFYNEMVEDFETGDLSQYDWETTANYPWTITTNNPYEGTYCLKSGGAGVNNVVSDLNLTVEIPNDGILSFFIKPSCENNWDFGHFYLDGTEMATFTGAGNWGEKRYPITEGEHTLRWSYTKDGSVNSNDDCVYLDYIRFNLLPEPPIAGNTYDFEDGMQGWTTIDADGDGFNWDMASNLMSGQAGHDGSADFVFSQSYSNTSGVLYPDNYFVSPQVQLGGQLRFYACAQDASYAAEHFGVAVSTTNNTSASAFTMVQEWTMSAKGDNNGKPVAMNTRSGRAQGTWYEYNVDLSAYAGQTGYIALRHFNCSDMFYLDVDDITIADPNRGVAEVEMNRSLNHFNIYRTDCYNDGPYNSDNTEFLSTVWLPDTAYFDVSWIDAAPGVYKWGVSAVYAGNQADNPNNPRIDYPFEERESEITWHTGCAPCIDKDMYILDGVTINVVLNSADSPEGTVVTFENTNPGEQLNHPMEPLTLDQTGYYVFPEFRKGNYNITIEKDGYFTQLDYQEIWTPMDLRYVLIEKIFNARELYVSRTGWAMWQPNGTLSNPEDDPMRHLEGYKIMCTSIDGEPIFNENTVAEQPFCQVATADLVEGEHYICKVAAIYSTGMSDYIEAEWQYEPCEHYAGVVDGVVNVEGSTISWTYPGGGDGPTPPPTPTEEATIVLSVPQDVWGDGSGYQMLIDADATAYGTIIPETGGLTTSGNAPAGLYDNFEYKIPENADGNLNTSNIIVTGSQSITIPAGTYDWCITNPTPGDRVWIASANGTIPGRYDDYEFEAGKTYTFTVTFGGTNDQVDLTITENGRALGFACNKPAVDNGEYRMVENTTSASVVAKTVVGKTVNFDNRAGWIYYDNGTVSDNILGLSNQSTGEVFPFSFGVMFPAGSYEGNTLTKTAYYDPAANTGNIEIYQGGTTAPTTLVYSQPYSTTGTEDFVEFTFTTPVTIDPAQNLWVVMHTDGGFVAALDTQNGNANGMWLYSDLLAEDWMTVVAATSGAYNGNWMIRAYLEEGTTPPTPPTPAEGVLGAMIFVDGEWEAFVPVPTNTYTYEGDGQEICVRIVYDGTAELPENNYYYAMSCGDCVGGIEPQPECPFDATLTYEVNDTDDQVNLFWGEQPEPPVPAEGTTFVYDFENSSLDGLTLIDADGDGNNWMLGSVAMSTGYGHNASVDMILSKSYDNNTGVLYPDNYIVFPIATIVEGSTFSFWGCGQDASYVAEHFGVAVSTDGTNFTTIQEWTMAGKGAAKGVRDGRDQGTWHQFSVDLSDYAGQEIYIALRHFNCSDMFYLDIDDVELSIAAKSTRDEIIGYNIYRSEDGISFDLIGTVAGDVYEYTDAPGAGSYYYYVTAVYEGCESAPTNTVQVGVTGVGDLSDNVNLFPNPTKGNVTIQAKDMNRITVVSVLGQVVFDTELDQDEYILNMAQFNTGMYMVRIYTDGGVTVKRVTVMH